MIMAPFRPGAPCERQAFAPAFTRRLAVLHRWLGLALCLWIALLLVTGSVLSFVPFPTLPEAARVAGGEPLDTRRVRVAPVDALAAAGTAPIARLRLVSVLDQPRYLLTPVAGPAIAVDALQGGHARPVTADQAAAIAQRFVGAPVHSVAGPLEDDQWTVHDGYAAFRPMWRVALADPAGTQLYVAKGTGEVVQRTQRRERAWNYVGAVVHWLNAVPLRRHYERWHDVVWALALAVAVLLLCGLTLGTLRTASLRRARGAGVSPFRGVQRWHHLAGFGAGIALLAWVTTGWLSLDADTLFSPEQPGPARIERLRGMPLARAAEAWSTTSLASSRARVWWNSAPSAAKRCSARAAVRRRCSRCPTRGCSLPSRLHGHPRACSPSHR